MNKKLSHSKKPFFSVVIPTLNEERFLPKLLKCLVKQIDRAFEVIIVDGGSFDQTLKKAGSFKGRFMKLSKITATARNVSLQRNLGAKAAKGCWLVFLDADTQVPPNYLSEIHNYLIQHKECHFLTTWSAPDSADKSGIAIVTLANLLLEASNSFAKPLVGGFNIVVSKQKFLKARGFDENWIPGMSEDHDFARRMKDIGESLHILKSPKVIMSLRRFRREGTFEVMSKYAKATLNLLTKGPLSLPVYEYEMGGKLKGKRIVGSFRKRIKKFVRMLEKY